MVCVFYLYEAASSFPIHHNDSFHPKHWITVQPVLKTTCLDRPPCDQKPLWFDTGLYFMCIWTCIRRQPVLSDHWQKECLTWISLYLKTLQFTDLGLECPEIFCHLASTWTCYTNNYNFIKTIFYKAAKLSFVKKFHDKI